MRRTSAYAFGILVLGCQTAGPAPAMRIEIALGPDSAELLSVRSSAEEPMELDAEGDLLLVVRDAETDAVLLEGGLPDRRRVWEESSVDDPESATEGPIIDS